MSNKKSNTFLWLGFGAAILGLWSQRYRFRQGQFLQPEKEEKSHRALITGASSGIGSAFARQLAARGYDLILVARRVDRMNALAKELIEKYGIAVETVPADLANEKDLHLVERVVQAGQLTLLVNNAGFGAPGLFSESKIYRQLDMIRLHDVATVALTHAALPGMIAKGKGGIIITSSLAAFFPLVHNANYSASKAYLNNFAESVQLELGNKGVYIQALCPGFTLTEFHNEIEMPSNRLPWFLWTQADDVVRQSLESLGTGEVIFIPGWINRVIAFFGRSLLTSGIAKEAAKFFLKRND